MKIYKFCLFLMPCFVKCSVYASIELEMCVFSVGQGNFIFLKCDKKCLIVDTGCGVSGCSALTKYSSSMAQDKQWGKMLIKMGNEKDIIFLITHDHNDHYCLFSHFLRILGEGQKVNISSQLQNSAKKFWDSCIKIDSNKKQESQKIAIVNGENIAKGSLGDNITVDVLSPSAEAKKVHEKNFVVFVKHGKTLFILPGDADGDYLELNAKAFIEKLKEIGKDCKHCCLILPHHGSNSNGALALPLGAKISLAEIGCNEMIFIISSDPQEKNHLPQKSILPLLPENPAVTEHCYMHAANHSMENVQITAPVFITREATDGLGYLITTEGNDMKLYDGITNTCKVLYSHSASN